MVLFIAMVLALAALGALAPFPAAAQDDRIQVRRSIHIEQPDTLVEAQVTGVERIAPNTLIESVRFGSQRNYYFTTRGKPNPDRMPDGQVRLSKDNGLTWSVIETWPASTPLGGDRRLLRMMPDFIALPGTDVVVRVYTVCEEIEGKLPWDKGAPNAVTRLVFSQFSRDNGRSWSEPAQVIVSGAEYSKEHWAPRVWYGENGCVVEGSKPLWLPDGRFLIPFWGEMTGGASRCSAGLIGGWRDDDSGMDWDITAYMTLPPEVSCQGAVEPCFTLLPDGRLYALVRARVTREMTSPSARYYFLSDNMGKSWSDPQLLRYDDGDVVYSPACLGHVFRAAKNGRYYVITNMLDEPTVGCDPRTRLQIAELDVKTLHVIRNTVTVIDERDAGQEQPETIRFSNWRWYEDRQTGDMVLLMTACPGDVGRFEECGVPPHSYRYDISLPGGPKGD